MLITPWTLPGIHGLDCIPGLGDDRYFWCRCGFFATKTPAGEALLRGHECRELPPGTKEKRSLLNLTCEVCGKPFVAARKHARTCSSSCRKKASIQRRRERKA